MSLTTRSSHVPQPLPAPRCVPGAPPTISLVPGPAAARSDRDETLSDHAAGLLGLLLDEPGREGCVTFAGRVPERPGLAVPWPDWIDESLIRSLQQQGISQPWRHQAEAADAAWSGESVVIATGTGSGKSLGFLLPALTSLLSPATAGGRPRGGSGLRTATSTVLYLSPTKALAADQLRSLHALELPVHAATFDGDTPYEERDLIRRAAGYVLTNPDMLHAGILPGHARWADFLRKLRFVVIDECHSYRGVFGSHMSVLMRRLRRICAHYGSEPAFLLASATVADPALSAEALTGVTARAVTVDTSPRGARTVALWEPPTVRPPTQNPAARKQTDPKPQGLRVAGRRSATAEAADLLADLTAHEARTLAFVRSRKGAESLAISARRRLASRQSSSRDVLGQEAFDTDASVKSDPYALPSVGAALPHRVAAYRAGYLPEERRRLERALRTGRLLGLASTNALELGVDIVGLDAVLIVGWPGTRASWWQQAGRAGRGGADSLVVFVGRDDPLDTYLLHHPSALLGAPIEATVFDPGNPHVLAPHLCAAAAELPLQHGDLALFGPSTEAVLTALTERGALRRRSNGWFWTRRDRAAALADLRGAGGPPVRIVEASTGRLLGNVDAASAPSAVHDGAVYLHQGESYVVARLDLDESVAIVVRGDPGYATSPRSVTDISILHTEAEQSWGEAQLCFGSVEVSGQVVAYRRTDPATGQVLAEILLDLPASELRTRAVWWTVSDEQLEAAGIERADVPGAAHAAEHAAIGLLPLFATCDRWDIGGVSTALHPDTGRMSVFVYDGAHGGAGFAARGYAAARDWLTATVAAIRDCRCSSGCPSCVQSPKCGSGNDPLHKEGAIRLLDTLLAGTRPSALPAPTALPPITPTVASPTSNPPTITSPTITSPASTATLLSPSPAEPANPRGPQAALPA